MAEHCYPECHCGKDHNKLLIKCRGDAIFAQKAIFSVFITPATHSFWIKMYSTMCGSKWYSIESIESLQAWTSIKPSMLAAQILN